MSEVRPYLQTYGQARVHRSSSDNSLFGRFGRHPDPRGAGNSGSLQPDRHVASLSGEQHGACPSHSNEGLLFRPGPGRLLIANRAAMQAVAATRTTRHEPGGAGIFQPSFLQGPTHRHRTGGHRHEDGTTGTTVEHATSAPYLHASAISSILPTKYIITINFPPSQRVYSTWSMHLHGAQGPSGKGNNCCPIRISRGWSTILMYHAAH
jgi:hypothetical protein